MERLRAAIIGCGGIARILHNPVLVGMDEVDITTFVDINVERLEQQADRFHIPRRFPSVEAFLEKPEVDCAFVATGPYAHAEPSIAIMEAGIDVFCEKPLARTLEEVRAMAAAAEKTDRVFMAGFNRRWMPAYLEAKKVFDDCPMDILSIEKNKPGLRERRCLLNDGIHMVDTMRWLCGEPTQVRAFALVTDGDPERERAIVANIEFDSGTLGALVIHRNGGKWLEKAELYGGGYTVIVDAADDTYICHEDKEERIHVSSWASLGHRLGFVGEFTHFLECVREHRQPMTNGEDALKTHELVHEIYTQAGLPGL